jgi:stringent starvation protein B
MVQNLVNPNTYLALYDNGVARLNSSSADLILGAGSGFICPASNNTHNLGSTSSRFKDLYTGTLKLTTNEIVNIGTGSITLTPASGETVNSRATLLPYDDDTYDLGSGSYRWNDIYATNDVIQTSDERLKTDIQNVNLGLDFVLALQPIEYIHKDTIIPEAKRTIEEEVLVTEIQTVTDTVEEVIDGKVVRRTVEKEVEVPIVDELYVYDEEGNQLYFETEKVETSEEVDDETGETRIVEEVIVTKHPETKKIPRKQKITREVTDRKAKTIKHTRKHYGLSAQQVVQVLQGMSITTEDFAGVVYDPESDRYGLRYGEFIAVIIKAIQEQQEQIEQLKTSHAKLEGVKE